MKFLSVCVIALSAVFLSACASEPYRPVVALDAADPLQSAFLVKEPTGDFTLETVFPQEDDREAVDRFIENRGGVRAHAGAMFRHFFNINGLHAPEGAQPRYEVAVEISEYEIKAVPEGVSYRLGATYRVSPPGSSEVLYEKFLLTSGTEKYQTAWGARIGTALAAGVTAGVTGIQQYVPEEQFTKADIEKTVRETYAKVVRQNTEWFLPLIRAGLKEAESKAASATGPGVS